MSKLKIDQLYQQAEEKYEEGDYSEALKILKKCINLNQYDARIYVLKGNIYDEYLEDRKLAITEYEKAIDLEPNKWSTWYNLGVCRGRNRSINLAISAYNRVIELNPECGDAYYNRGVQQYLKDNIKMAYNDWKKAYELGIAEAADAIDKLCS